MKTLGNIIWHFPFFGFVTATANYLTGLLLVMTVVAAPVGFGVMELGKFLFWPFGNAIVSKSELNVEQNRCWKQYSKVVMILYFPFGLFFTIIVIIQIIGLFISIIGIPAALVLAKGIGAYINPVNKICVPSAVADELSRRKAQEQVDNHFGRDNRNQNYQNPQPNYNKEQQYQYSQPTNAENHPPLAKSNLWTMLIIIISIIILYSGLKFFKSHDFGTSEIVQSDLEPEATANEIERNDNYENESYSKENESDEIGTNPKPLQIIKSYYRNLLEHNCSALPNYFPEIISRFYSSSNISSIEIVTNCENYQEKWKYMKLDIDDNSVIVNTKENGGTELTYNMLYKIKKKQNDKWKIFDLKIFVVFDENLKITSIYEKRN